MEEKAFAQQKEKSRTKDRSNRVAYFRFTSANSRQNMSRRVAPQPRRVDIVLRVCLQNYAGFWVACFRAPGWRVDFPVRLNSAAASK
jgi:hypothetical protein